VVIQFGDGGHWFGYLMLDITTYGVARRRCQGRTK
jgi:hypothetical protein